MVLVRIEAEGIRDVYAVYPLQKEFMKAANEPWKDNPPWKRYQSKLMQDLAVLCEYKEYAINFAQYEKITGEEDLYSIRHPETRKNLRIIYTIKENVIILLIAFLEKNSGDYQNAIRRARRRLKSLEA